MFQKTLFKGLRWILSPFSLLYALVLGVRNLFFDINIIKQTSFDIPVIAVGNLSVGGTGKTPQIEYLIRLLEDEYTIAVLSRGYKRKSEGFVIANDKTTVEEIGDEPFQFFKKFQKIIVAVDTNRVNGINQLLKTNSKINLILLDDAYQHRKVKARFYALLTSYDNLYTKDFVLPLGDLREAKSGAKRANAIIVTKCPVGITQVEKNAIVDEIKPTKFQNVFFSSIAYDNVIHSNKSSLGLKEIVDYDVVLITGIAKPEPLLDALNSIGIKFTHLNFPDHHNFSPSDIDTINETFDKLKNAKKLILTTEKDFTRLSNSIENIFSLGIRTSIIDSGKFDSFVKGGI